jgi:hypothetical protein
VEEASLKTCMIRGNIQTCCWNERGKSQINTRDLNKGSNASAGMKKNHVRSACVTFIRVP